MQVQNKIILYESEYICLHCDINITIMLLQNMENNQNYLCQPTSDT